MTLLISFLIASFFFLMSCSGGGGDGGPPPRRPLAPVAEQSPAQTVRLRFKFQPVRFHRRPPLRLKRLPAQGLDISALHINSDRKGQHLTFRLKSASPLTRQIFHQAWTMLPFASESSSIPFPERSAEKPTASAFIALCPIHLQLRMPERIKHLQSTTRLL